MARDTTATLSARPGAFQTLQGEGRGHRTRIALDLNDALAPCLEGASLCDDIDAAVARILAAAGAGSRQAVVNEAGRLGYRAAQFREEFARMAGAIERRPGPSVA